MVERMMVLVYGGPRDFRCWLLHTESHVLTQPWGCANPTHGECMKCRRVWSVI